MCGALKYERKKSVAGMGNNVGVTVVYLEDF
jgi:hypothetical protein